MQKVRPRVLGTFLPTRLIILCPFTIPRPKALFRACGRALILIWDQVGLRVSQGR